MIKAKGQSYYDNSAKEIVLKIKPSLWWFFSRKYILIVKDDLKRESEVFFY